MPVTLNMFDNRALSMAINRAKPVQSFILDKLFPRKEPHAADKIDIEIISGKDRLAQVVNKGEGPHILQKDDRVYQTVTLPRTYEEYIFAAQEMADYKALGEIYNNDPNARATAVNEWITKYIDELKTRVVRLREKMACDAVTTGATTVDQTNVKMTFNFNFKSDTIANGGHIIPALSGNYVWGGTSADINGWIYTGRRTVAKRTGRAPNIGILGYDAADAFLKDDGVLKMLNNLNTKVGVIDLSQSSPDAGIYIGRYLGIDWYVYGQSYTNTAGTVTEMFDPKIAMLTSINNTNNRIHLGPAYRIKNQQLVTTVGEYLITVDEDRKGQYVGWECEQKSLPTPHNPDDFLIQNVIGA